ncbi:unnamed protein product [Urochloa decumbens]|uniref:F-box domain-containing protein n=1 Tax=Urochloa decumbens TaxID=240449 RepID=A0ABC9FM49_9POAL
MAPPRAMLMLDELIEEILFRLPPNDPANLVRASHICKLWRRVVSDPGFRRRFSEFHRMPPMLGFFWQGLAFVQTAPSCPPLATRRRDLYVDDARHGRVLLHNMRPWDFGGDYMEDAFVVWDPITGEQRELPPLPVSMRVRKATVVCAAAAASLDGVGCDHLNCHGGPFLVVSVACRSPLEISTFVYSSEAGAWSEAISGRHHLRNSVLWIPSVLVRNTLYFALRYDNKIMEFNLGTRQMYATICLPPLSSLVNTVLMNTEAGGLGLATTVDTKLYLWSREVAGRAGGHQGWTQAGVVELGTILPAITSHPEYLGVVAAGVTVIFLRTYDGIFAFDLNSCQAAMVCKGIHHISDIICPYMSFYTPPVQLIS